MPFISQEQLLKVIIGFNPWWHTGKIPASINRPTRRTAFYEMQKVFQHPQIRRSILISGARRVGKTTIMYQMMDDLLVTVPAKQILYISFDHPMLKLSAIDEIMEVYRTYILSGEQNLYLFFDEIQYASDWNHWLKILYDQFPSYKMVATGSASPILTSGMAESGAGRWTQIKVPTLSFYEYIELLGVEKPKLDRDVHPFQLQQLTNQQLTDVMMALAPLQTYFHMYLFNGGFPEMALSDDLPFVQKIIREDVVDKVIKRDIVSLFNVRNISEFEKIFLYLCLTSGQILVQDTISKEIGVSRQTISNYIELLVQANLIYLSKPIELGEKQLLKSRPKVYLTDPAIRNAVLMLGEEMLTHPEEMGMMIETTVFKHVYAYFYRQQLDIHYYRDAKTQKEIDMIVSLPRGNMLIEVKYRQNSSLSETEAIVQWSNDPKTISATLVTKTADDFGMTKHHSKTPIVRVPAFAFLYLLGHSEKALVR